jgi:uncharacterized protein (TIGR00299 family) protein
MKIAYLDTVGGIAGDMTMAAFVDAGLPLEELSAELAKLGMGGFELAGRHVLRNSIRAVQIDVVVNDQPRYHRHLKDILAIIDRSTLSAGVKERASAVFGVIAGAEAKVHGSTPEKVHFHEVGAVDSIVDIVGAAICLEKAGVDRVYSSPVKLGGGGTVGTQHGVMPVPAPATAEILRGYPTVLTDVPHELTTPTGAAIVKAFSLGTLSSETLSVEAVGYGAGTKEFPELPNLLRVLLADMPGDAGREEILLVETNIDDMNPQVYPYLIERLLAAGAHDAYLVPVVMKKGRPGVLVSAMVPPGALEAVSALLYAETTTIGLRILTAGRRKLLRRHIVVDTSFGPVRAKAVLREGRETVAPEFEECRRIALERGIPLHIVMQRLRDELAGPG